MHDPKRPLPITNSLPVASTRGDKQVAGISGTATETDPDALGKDGVSRKRAYDLLLTETIWDMVERCRLRLYWEWIYMSSTSLYFL